MPVNEQRYRLFKNTTWMVLARAFRAGEAIIRSIVVARFLGVELYASYAVISAFALTWISVFNANIGTTLVKFGTELKEAGDAPKFRAIVRLAYVSTAALYALYCLVSVVATIFLYDVFFTEPGLRWQVILFSVASGASLFGLLGKTLLLMHNRFKVNTFVDISVSTLNVLIVLLVSVTYKQSLTAVVVAIAATIVFSELASNLAAFIELRGALKKWYCAPLVHLEGRFRGYYKFTFANAFARALEGMTKSLDILILASVASAPAVAVYDIARKLAGTLLLLKDPISLAAMPQFASLIARKEFITFKQLIHSVYMRMLPLGFGIFLLVALTDKWLLVIWGADFQDPGWVVLLAISRTMIILLFFWVIPLVLNMGLVRIRLVAVVVGSFTGFTLSIILVRTHGAEGVAFAMLIGALLNYMIMAIIGLRRIEKQHKPT